MGDAHHESLQEEKYAYNHTHTADKLLEKGVERGGVAGPCRLAEEVTALDSFS